MDVENLLQRLKVLAETCPEHDAGARPDPDGPLPEAVRRVLNQPEVSTLIGAALAFERGDYRGVRQLLATIRVREPEAILLAETELSLRAMNALADRGVLTLGAASRLDEYELLAWPQWGPTYSAELKMVLRKYLEPVLHARKSSATKLAQSAARRSAASGA